MGIQSVVTFQLAYHSTHRYSLCRRCEEDCRDDPSIIGALGPVSHGQHAGTCYVCDGWMCSEEGGGETFVVPAYGGDSSIAAHQDNTAHNAAERYAILTWEGEGRADAWLTQQVYVRRYGDDHPVRLDVTITPSGPYGWPVASAS